MIIAIIPLTIVALSVYFHYLHKRGKKAERELHDKLSGYWPPKGRHIVKTRHIFFQRNPSSSRRCNRF